jgi:hypothetical protein
MIFETYGFFTLIDVFQASLIIHRQTGGRLWTADNYRERSWRDLLPGSFPVFV